MLPALMERVEAGSEDPGRKLALRHLLAGVQAGVTGALALIACLMVGALWDGQSIWVTPNLFATTFLGIDVYRDQFLRASLTGIALIVVAYGILGGIWGCIWRSERQKWLRLYGVVAGFCVYLLLYGPLSRHINPLFTLYAPDRQLEFGHLLWGLALARSPVYARRIALITNPPVPQAISAPAVNSGEVIL